MHAVGAATRELVASVDHRTLAEPQMTVEESCWCCVHQQTWFVIVPVFGIWCSLSMDSFIWQWQLTSGCRRLLPFDW